MADCSGSWLGQNGEFPIAPGSPPKLEVGRSGAVRHLMPNIERAACSSLVARDPLSRSAGVVACALVKSS